MTIITMGLTMILCEKIDMLIKKIKENNNE